MRNASTTCLALSLAASLAGACTSTAPDPERVVGQFAAVSFNGQPLPAPLESSGDEQRTLVADTLSFRSNGTVRRTFTIRTVAVGTGSEGMVGGELEQAYRRSGTWVAIGFFRRCPANAICMANDTGTIAGMEIMLRTKAFGWRVDRQVPVELFRRVSP